MSKKKARSLNNETDKYCPKCDTVKPRGLEHFHKHKSRKDGLNAWCKECVRAKFKSKEHREYLKEWRDKNPDKVKAHQGKYKEYHVQYRLDNADRRKQYYQDNKERINARNAEYRRARRQRDPVYRLRLNIGSSVCKALKRYDGTKGNTSVMDYLPYTIHELVEHLENQWDDKMNWDNYGSYWDIDHIYPQSLLPYETMEDENFLKSWSLDNLQPLEKIANIKKSNKIL